MSTKGTVAVFVSTVFISLFFTETIAPICDFDDSRDRDSWDTGRPDYRTYNCVWESWSSWSGCWGGKQERLRVGHDDANNCRCDMEFQTQSCGLVGKSESLCLFLPRGPQAEETEKITQETQITACPLLHTTARYASPVYVEGKSLYLYIPKNAGYKLPPSPSPESPLINLSFFRSTSLLTKTISFLLKTSYVLGHAFLKLQMHPP